MAILRRLARVPTPLALPSTRLWLALVRHRTRISSPTSCTYNSLNCGGGGDDDDDDDDRHDDGGH